ncbi:MAG TPA: hypothetical protein VF796_22935 [Humisphaera sp.]
MAHRTALAGLLLAFFLIHWTRPEAGAAPAASPASAAPDLKPIPRKLPPPGDATLDPADRAKIEAELSKVQARLKALEAKPDPEDLLADVRVYEKAVRFALLHNEFYGAKKPAAPAKPAAGAKPAAKPAAPAADAKPQPPRGVAACLDLLKSAGKRLDELEAGKHSWTTQKGAIVRGYTSAVDGSAQPYGLEIAEELDLSKPVPLYIWLHGRGDTDTDLYFIKGREGKKGEMPNKGAIVLHPLGRQCVGFKSAGEIDVLDAIESVKRRYKIDENRIVLAGFSMGGAGTWHLGAHYADRFVVVQPGAGFIDVKRYQGLDPATTPAAEATLWGLYDVPDYVHNLFNTTVLSYSGENDKQRASARIMADVFKAEGRELPQFIGPNVEHKYLPLPDLIGRITDAVKKGRDAHPKQVTLQTRTLRYNKMFWVEAVGLEEHWKDARIDATVRDDAFIEVRTKNVTEFVLKSPWGRADQSAGGPDRDIRVNVDGRPVLPAFVPADPADRASMPRLTAKALASGVRIWRVNNGWVMPPDGRVEAPPLRKSPGLQGPIDDAFMSPFLFVLPTGKAASPATAAWVEFESKHQIDRWRALFRGDPRVKKDTEVTPDDLKHFNVICWGDAASNAVIAKMADKLPATWAGGKLSFGGKQYDAATHVPAVIFPNPLNPARYVVLNSGPTFREAHDGTNSQQNPKLGDWAIIDVTTPPSAAAPGNVVANGFFDEAWKVK